MEEKLKTVISNVFELTSDKIDESTTMESIEQWDSLKHMNLVVALEEEFKTEFTDDEILKMMNYTLIKSILLGKGIN